MIKTHQLFLDVYFNRALINILNSFCSFSFLSINLISFDKVNRILTIYFHSIFKGNQMHAQIIMVKYSTKVREQNCIILNTHWQKFHRYFSESIEWDADFFHVGKQSWKYSSNALKIICYSHLIFHWPYWKWFA